MIKILHVEDSDTQAERFALCVKSFQNGYGWEVRRVTTLEAARSLVEESDLIVLDLLLDDATVNETIAAIPEMAQRRPLLVITSNAHSAITERCLRCGAIGVVHKPVTPEKLRDSFLTVIAESNVAKL